MSLQSNIKNSFSKHFKKMRNSYRVSIKINMAICHMGTSSSRAAKQQMIAQQVLEKGRKLTFKNSSHDTKTSLIGTFCTLFERLMREQCVSFSDDYYDKKFK